MAENGLNMSVREEPLSIAIATSYVCVCVYAFDGLDIIFIFIYFQ